MFNDLSLVSRLWFNEIVFGNDMIISFKLRINFQPTIHSLISLSFKLTPLLLYFSPSHQEVAGTPDRPSDCIYILSLGHVMVLDCVNVFVGTFWSSCSFGIVFIKTQYFGCGCWVLEFVVYEICFGSVIFIFVDWECYIYKGDSAEFSAESLLIEFLPSPFWWD